MLYDDSDTDSDLEFIDFQEKDATPNPWTKLQEIASKKESNEIKLPPPKIKETAPAPPEPIKIINPDLVNAVETAKTEKDQIIKVDAEELRNRLEQLAEENAMVSDKAAFNGVGHDRAKSMLTYLADVDVASRNIYESQIKRSTRARARSTKMYGW